MFQKSALRIFERRYRLRRLVPCRAGSRVRRVDRGDRTLDRRPQPGHLRCGERIRRHFADAGAGREREHKALRWLTCPTPRRNASVSKRRRRRCSSRRRLISSRSSPTPPPPPHLPPPPSPPPSPPPPSPPSPPFSFLLSFSLSLPLFSPPPPSSPRLPPPSPSHPLLLLPPPSIPPHPYPHPPPPPSLDPPSPPPFPASSPPSPPPRPARHSGVGRAGRPAGRLRAHARGRRQHRRSGAESVAATEMTGLWSAVERSVAAINAAHSATGTIRNQAA